MTVIFRCEICSARPDPETQVALERQLLDLRHGEYVDADPGRWLTWHGRGVYGPTRYACGEHRGELKALIREHYGTLGWHPWAMGPHPWAGRRGTDKARRLARTMRSTFGVPAPSSRPPSMRTCVRVGGGDDPARRPRRVLRLGRAARRSAPARPPGDRRRRGRARGELRGEGVRRPHRDGRRAGPAAVPARRSSSRRGCRPTPRRARRSSRSSTTPPRWSRACRSTRPSSTCAGCARISGTPREIAARLRRDVRERVGLPITVGVARTKFLAKVASGVAKPDGLLRRAARRRSWRSCTRCRSSGSGASGAVTARKLHDRGHQHRRRGRRSSPSRAGRDARAGRPAGTCTRSPTTAIRGRCRRGRRRRSIGSQRALGRAGRSRRASSTPPWSALVDRLGAAPARGPPGLPHGGAAAALRRLLARDPLAHAVRGHRPDRRRSWPPRGSCSRSRCR